MILTRFKIIFWDSELERRVTFYDDFPDWSCAVDYARDYVRRNPKASIFGVIEAEENDLEAWQDEGL